MIGLRTLPMSARVEFDATETECVITIRIPLSDATRAMAALHGVGKLEATREDLAQEERARSKAEGEQRRAAALADGRRFLERYGELRPAAESAADAWARVYDAHKESPSYIDATVRLARATEARDRDATIADLYRQGLSNAAIAARTGVSVATVARSLTRLRQAPPPKTGSDAGAGSRGFSGDRARSARRKPLDAAEASPRSQQGSGTEEAPQALPRSPDPVNSRETSSPHKGGEE